jgi:hypothetical protein
LFKLTTGGTLYLARMPIVEPLRITNLLFWLVTKGATLTAAECFIGLFAGGTRKLLGKVSAAETIAQMEGTNGSLATCPLEASVPNIPAGSVEVGIFCNGTTMPTLGAGPATPAGLLNAGEASTAKNDRFSTGETGLTTALPTEVTASQTADAAPIFVGAT